MSVMDIHQCQCPHCQQAAAHPDQVLHRQMNLLLSRLDEQQRRWYVAVEANRIGPQGKELIGNAQECGANVVSTCRRGECA
jgi:hypothetical protein